MLAMSHNAISGKVQAKGMSISCLFMAQDFADSGAEFQSVLMRSQREYAAALNGDKPFELSYADYATLRCYNEFKVALGRPNLKLKELHSLLSTVFHLTPHENPRGQREFPSFYIDTFPVVTM